MGTWCKRKKKKNSPGAQLPPLVDLHKMFQSECAPAAKVPAHPFIILYAGSVAVAKGTFCPFTASLLVLMSQHFVVHVLRAFAADARTQS